MPNSRAAVRSCTPESWADIALDVFGSRGRLGPDWRISAIASPPPGWLWKSPIALAPEVASEKPDSVWRRLGLSQEDEELIDSLAALVAPLTDQEWLEVMSLLADNPEDT